MILKRVIQSFIGILLSPFLLLMAASYNIVQPLDTKINWRSFFLLVKYIVTGKWGIFSKD